MCTNDEKSFIRLTPRCIIPRRMSLLSEMQILAWLYIKITKTTASSVFEMELWQAGTYLDDTVNAYSYCRNEAGGRWGSGGFTPENFSGPLPLQRWKTSFWNMGERCCHHLLSSSEGKLIP